MDTRKVVVFGGAFSPPTLAHEAIIAGLLTLPQFSEVWVMPSGDRLDKDMSARDSDRMAMLELVRTHSFSNDPRLAISDFELRMPRPSQTFQTVEALEQAFPNVEFWFAYGPDSYVSMPSWPGGDKLQQKLRMVIFSSGGPKVSVQGPAVHLDISTEFSDTSSTEARRVAADPSELDKIVSWSVVDYIQTHQLFAI